MTNLKKKQNIYFPPYIWRNNKVKLGATHTLALTQDKKKKKKQAIEDQRPKAAKKMLLSIRRKIDLAKKKKNETKENLSVV